MRDPETKPPPLANAAAFGVHIFTASGTALALFALIAAVERAWPQMFLLLGAALLVDGVDGMFARRLDVAARLPRWSGDVLDLVVDYLTYVFIPAFVVVWSDLLPGPLSVPCAIAILISGALYFADREMKTKDNFFRGFPAVWNVPMFYLLLLQPPALDRRRGIVRARGGNVPAGSVRASVSRRALPRAHPGVACSLVRARRHRAVARHDARPMDNRGPVCHRALLPRRRVAAVAKTG